jgi:hypothetical protein
MKRLTPSVISGEQLMHFFRRVKRLLLHRDISHYHASMSLLPLNSQFGGTLIHNYLDRHGATV